MIKRTISALTAVIMLLCAVLPVAYAEGGTDSQDSPPLMTVVGKKIQGDNEYFEISIEVDKANESKFSSIGVILQYNADYIVPAASWDDEAGIADMSKSTSWSTRRALPTLGKPTWETRRAYAYEDPKPEEAGAPHYGYLYLGATNPGERVNANLDPENPSESDEPAPTAEPDTDADPYSNPVVVARFKYVIPEGQTGTDIKKYITDHWNPSGNTRNWKQNEILKVAPDSVSCASASPLGMGFTVYMAESLTMYSYQDANDSADGDGDKMRAASQIIPATGDMVDIVITEGKSARASDGLSLTDIYVIMFYDWDNSLLGSLTAGMGEDATESVNEYVKSQFIHPDLREFKDDDDMTAEGALSAMDKYTSKAREYTYRGEYPYDAPDPELKNIPGSKISDDLVFPDNAELAGSKYPLTNKLDYCFAGKDFYTVKSALPVVDEEGEEDPGTPMPFVGGWTRVLPVTLDDTWTALSNENFAPLDHYKEEKDSNGETVYTDPLDKDGNVIDLISVDFSDIEVTSDDGSVVYVKAVYEPGTLLDNAGPNYTAQGPITYMAYGDDGIYSISFKYIRVNDSGYGVSRIKDANIRTDIRQVDATSTFVVPYALEGVDSMPVTIMTSKGVEEINYILVDVNNANIINGSQVSIQNESINPDFGMFQREKTDRTGFQTLSTIAQIMDYCLKGETVTYSKVNEAGISNAGSAWTSKKYTSTYKNALTTFANNAKVVQNTDTPTATFYQMQYAILNGGEYKDADAAREACKTAYSSWLTELQ